MSATWTFVVSGGLDCELRVWDFATGACLQTLQAHAQPVGCVAVGSNAILSGGWDGDVRVHALPAN